MQKFLIFFVILLSGMLSAQDFDRLNIAFTVDGQILEFPLTGGLNAPQVSGVDLNHDGVTDLFVNDRIGGVPMAFVYDVSVKGNYRFDPGLTKYFPTTENWALMMDYNGDGVPDLFSYSIAPGIDGISPYRGKWLNDTLHFDLVTSTGGPSPLILPYSVANGSKGNLYVTTIDIPAIADMDGDGDLDIMAFDTGGGFINYYRNNSIEKGYGKDSLIYVLDDQCWGKVFEGLSSTISMSSDPNQCSLGVLGGGITTRHVGSTLMAADLDGDGDKDMLVGDVSYGKITALFNTGTAKKAWVTAQDTVYPNYDVPVLFPDFPASYMADVNADGKVDFVFATNSTGITEDREVFQWYSPVQPGFTEMRKSASPLLTDQMLDLGTGTHPAFMDVDNDGDLDMIVGNFSHFTNLTQRNAQLYLYTNTGTSAQPAFELTDEDFLGFSQFHNIDWGFAPATGDLDGDGDTDLIVGSEEGILYYCENTAGKGNIPVFAPVVVKYMDIDVGQAAAPFIYDVDGDGLKDLVIGERNGNINFLPNQGEQLAPAFSSNPDKAPNINFFGKIDTRQPGYASGYSSPVIFRVDDKLQLVTGSLSGEIHWYKDIENNFTNKFTLVTKTLGNIREGERVKPVLVKLLEGDHYQLAAGNMRGGLAAYQTNIPVSSTGTKNQQLLSGISLYPNPATDFINISIHEKTEIKSLKATIFDQLGRIVKSQDVLAGAESIKLGGLMPGLYFVQLSSDDANRVFKIIRK